ncbi:hypothetical protein [Raoultibacter phocaeensis]|uniref:hypothetical protein n=1 Tax=Raoultibacter phocaeensis TaxID=2479841 RepID=UPI00111B3B0C|nr:hypothetical protein [Raoultibacter phocaeensis]
MLTSANVDFISYMQDTFEGRDKKDIAYQKVTFLHETDDKPITLSALMELDFSQYHRYQPVTVTINLWMDNNGYLKGKIVGCEA